VTDGQPHRQPRRHSKYRANARAKNSSTNSYGVTVAVATTSVGYATREILSDTTRQATRRKDQAVSHTRTARVTTRPPVDLRSQCPTRRWYAAVGNTLLIAALRRNDSLAWTSHQLCCFRQAVAVAANRSCQRNWAECLLAMVASRPTQPSIHPGSVQAWTSHYALGTGAHAPIEK